jgi:hypothetical protein
VGPYDLGNNIGHPVLGEFDPELKEAIAKILKAAQDAGKKSGVYATSGEQARAYADQGFQMVCVRIFTVCVKCWPSLQISCMNDMGAIPIMMTQSLQKAKGSYVHGAVQAVKGAAYGASSLVSSQQKQE